MSAGAEETTTQEVKENAVAEQTTNASTVSSPTAQPPSPLHRKWVLWYDNRRQVNPEANTTWEENLKNCGSFDSVESFWQVINNVKPPSNLMVDSNYHMFREGVKPMWEDPENKNGGKLVLTAPKKDKSRVDDWWLYTILAIVGEMMDVSGNQVCGAVLSIRKSQDRIALWLKSSDRDVCIPIGERWKKALELTAKTTLKFQLHKDAAAQGTSFRNETKFEI